MKNNEPQPFPPIQIFIMLIILLCQKGGDRIMNFIITYGPNENTTQTDKDSFTRSIEKEIHDSKNIYTIMKDWKWKGCK